MSCLCAALFELSSGKEQKELRRPRASPSKFPLLCLPPDAMRAGLGAIAAAPDCPPGAEQFWGTLVMTDFEQMFLSLWCSLPLGQGGGSETVVQTESSGWQENC